MTEAEKNIIRSFITSLSYNRWNKDIISLLELEYYKQLPEEECND